MQQKAVRNSRRQKGKAEEKETTETRRHGEK